MDEYISRHEAIRAVQLSYGNYEATRKALYEIPAADVAPVRHGRWVSLIMKRENWKGVLHDFYQPFSCSICQNPNTFMGESAFCPHCGAKMIKEK